MSNYLNDPSVKQILHIPNSVTWVDADETGPVSDNLKSDFTLSVIPQVE